MTSNFIDAYYDVLSADICRKTCERMDDIISRPEPGKGCVLSDDYTRKDWNIFSSVYGSLKTCEEAILEAVMFNWRKYNSKYSITSKAFLEMFDPGWKLQRSETGGGFNTWHYEQGPGNNSRARFAVWMLYLNDVNDGGQTEFKHQEINFSPKAGALLFWPASYTHVHRAAPDLIGTKYIATGWLNYPIK